MDMLELCMYWRGTGVRMVFHILIYNSFTYLFLYWTWPIHVGLRCDKNLNNFQFSYTEVIITVSVTQYTFSLPMMAEYLIQGTFQKYPAYDQYK
jgi:hypothetical protein